MNSFNEKRKTIDIEIEIIYIFGVDGKEKFLHIASTKETPEYSFNSTC